LTAVTGITRQAGITQAAFEACLNNQAILDALNAVRDRATSVFGVDSTPTFFVNGRKATGSDADLEALIGTLL
ncbi:thioredoxin domain-containing protein, partial [Cutibacterium acnes]